MATEVAMGETPSGIPYYFERSPRNAQDPACPDNVDGWDGANDVTIKLLLALESLRDLRVVLQDLLAQEQPYSDRRRIKGISTPLVSFTSAIQKICKELLGHPDSIGGLSDEVKAKVNEYLQEIVRVFPPTGNSPLRTVRNKIDAHVDESTVEKREQIWDHVDLSLFLPWIACALIHFSELLALEVYGWTCKSTHPDVFRLMSVDGTLVDLLVIDEKPSRIVGISITTSPKVGIAEELNAVITLYNALLQSPPAHSAS